MDPVFGDYFSFILVSAVLSSASFWIAAGLMLVLLVSSALISGSEVAFFSITPTQLEELKISNKPEDNAILDLMLKPDKEKASRKLLATILVANNFINVAIILVSSFVVDPFFVDSTNELLQILIQVVLVTFLLVLFGEVIPKVYATSNNMALATFMAKPITALEKLTYPLSKPLIGLTKLIDRRKAPQGSVLSIDELSQALELTNDAERSEGEQKILEGIIYFGTKDAKQVMTSRVDIDCIDINMSFDEVLVYVTEIGYSRIPVYTETLDTINGILYLKDLLPYIHRKHFEWTSLLRSPFFVPENKKIDDLLREFQEKKIHMSIVVDEYGGTSGLVTLEDIIEEIVGDITDEFDDEDLQYTKIDDLNYVFEGKTALIDLYRVLDIDGTEMESAKGDADSLGGFVVEQAGKIPLKNEKIIFEMMTFTVEAADKRRVKRVKVTVPENDMQNAE
ncbi:MAG: gliding motility-associated protein GldE [Flavobacteriales bacterium]